MALSCFQEAQRLTGPQLCSLECSALPPPPKEFSIKVQEWDAARAKGWGSTLGMVCLRVCTCLSRPQVPHLCPFLTRCSSPFITLGWSASLVTGMRPGRGCTQHGNMSAGAPVPAGQTAGHIQIFALSRLSHTFSHV